MEDSVAKESGVAEILTQQRPLQSVFVSGDTGGEDGGCTEVVAVVGVDNPLGGNIVGTVAHVVVVVEDRA